MKEYDVIWIGTGQATGTVLPRLMKAGKSVALVEGGRFGGSCVNYGCTPTKTIIASARAAHMARRGPDFGVITGDVTIDFARVMERQNEMRHGASDGLEEWLRNMDGVTVYAGYGRFTGPHTVQVNDDEIEGEGIAIQTGARVQRLAQEEPQQIDVFFEQDGQTKQVRGSHLLLAMGRVPNSDRLNLAAAGVETDEQGYIQVNGVMQTSVPHIFAVGDINGEGAFTHTAVNDGEIFWDFYGGEEDRILSERFATYALFIDPPLGRVGMSEKEARESGRNVLMATRGL